MNKVAYLINQYPKVSHTFIRREILALQAQGVTIHRFALRGWDAELTDPVDVEERSKTRYVLQDGLLWLLPAVLGALVRNPKAWFSGLAWSWRLSKGGDKGLIRHFVYMAEACWLLHHMNALGVQHVHAHFGTNSAAVAALLNALGGPKFSFTVHGPEEFDKPVALHLATKVKLANFVVGISSFGRSQILRWLPYSEWRKVHVVRCGLDEAFLRSARAAVPVELRFVCVGRLCEQKGQLLLVDALHQLRRSDGICAKLVLVGDGEMRSAIEERVSYLGLTSAVRITGWIASGEVKAEIESSRALVLPSFAEGLPVAIMEAMALGRPVITTMVAGIPELVRQNQDGWLVPAGDVDSLVSAMRACALMSTMRIEEMGTNARARVRERHDIASEAAQLFRLLHKSCEKI